MGGNKGPGQGPPGGYHREGREGREGYNNQAGPGGYRDREGGAKPREGGWKTRVESSGDPVRDAAAAQRDRRGSYDENDSRDTREVRETRDAPSGAKAGGAWGGAPPPPGGGWAKPAAGAGAAAAPASGWFRQARPGTESAGAPSADKGPGPGPGAGAGPAALPHPPGSLFKTEVKKKPGPSQADAGPWSRGAKTAET